MMKPIAAYHTALLAMSAPLCASAWAADLYRSGGSNGEERYASQAWDPSYVLYSRDEPATGSTHVPATQKTVAPANRGQSRYAAVDSLIDSLSRKYTVDAALVRAVIEVESQFNPRAVSRKGAVGLMQLMPATAARYGVTNRDDVAQNIEAGVRYLKDLLTLHNGNIALALASYNAGEAAVARHGQRIPPYRETLLYVPAVLARMHAGHSVHSQ